MLPYRRLVWGLTVVVIPVYVLCLIGAGMTTVARLSSNTWSFPVILAIVVFLIGLPVGVFLLHARKRAERILKKRPDLLGIVEGTISMEGMLFDDGLRKHWFAARSMGKSRVLKSGVRVQWTHNSYHYLALSTRLFDDFDAKVLGEWIQQWRLDANSPADLQPAIQPVSRLGDIPADAINFSGQLQLQMPTDTPESRRQAWSLTIQMFITIVILLLTSMSNPGGWSGLTLAMLIGTILYAWAVFATWRLIYQGNSLQIISQSGWVSQSELLIEVAGNASRCPITCFQIQPVTDQGVIWFVGEVGMVAIKKEILASSDDWQRLMDWFGK